MERYAFYFLMKEKYKFDNKEKKTYESGEMTIQFTVKFC